MGTQYEAQGVVIEAVADTRYQMDAHGQRFCVYAHVYEETIFYIGQGRLSRPFIAKDRNTVWRRYVQEHHDYHVEILGLFATRELALSEELRLIKLFQPCCNLKGVQPETSHARRRFIEPRIQLSVRIPLSTKRLLDQFCQQHGVSSNAVVNRAIQKMLNPSQNRDMGDVAQQFIELKENIVAVHHTIQQQLERAHSLLPLCSLQEETSAVIKKAEPVMHTSVSRRPWWQRVCMGTSYIGNLVLRRQV